ncbi:unnamed protein product, partial [Meganyctiphanes norvegica]
MAALCQLLLLTLAIGLGSCVRYEADWDSLDTRPLPTWYDDAKIGIFIHWGIFSVPSYGLPDDDGSRYPGGQGAVGEWFWKRWNVIEARSPFFSFRLEQTISQYIFIYFFLPGAKYIVLTSKHHEGYTLWPSKYSWNWNSMDVGAKRDIVGELAKAIRNNTDLTFGLYHSLYEWFHPMYLEDKANNFQTNEFVLTKTLPELYEIVNEYGPEVIFSDGDWESDSTYFNSTIFLAWLFNDSPVKDTIVVNDRWGKDATCKHGSYLTCTDRYNPGTLQSQKWENALTFDRYSWGFRRNANMDDYLSIEDTLEQLISTISCGGNMLINIGPTKEGMLPAIMEERLLQMGEWLDINGEGIYASKPWTHQNDTLTPGVWYTSKNDKVYAFVLDWPAGSKLVLGSVKSTETTSVTILGQNGETLKVVEAGNGLEVTFPPMSQVKSKWSWVLELTGVQANPRAHQLWR